MDKNPLFFVLKKRNYPVTVMFAEKLRCWIKDNYGHQSEARICFI